MLARLKQSWLNRRHPPQQGRIALSMRQLYILPSRQGLGFAFLCLLILVGAINYQLSLAFFVAFLLIGIAHACMLRSYANLLHLQIAAQECPAVFAGEMAHFPLQLSDTRQRTRHRIHIKAQGQSAISLLLPAGHTDTVTLSVPTRQRGWLQLPHLEIESGWPLGWFRVWSYIPPGTPCLVYPQAEIQAPELPLAGGKNEAGRFAVRGDDDFAGLRAYQPGDPLRLIAWRQFAHSDTLQAKAFQNESGHDIALSWELVAHLPVEAGLSRLCAWVLAAERNGLRYALILPALTLPAEHGAVHCHQCLSALALFEAKT